MKVLGTLALALGVAAAASGAANLPGFGVRALGSTSGFLTSLAIDSSGIIYYTTQSGAIFRFTDGRSTPVARVATVAHGDAGLLGMALLGDDKAIVHYTEPAADPTFVTYDVISIVDLRTGAERVWRRFAGDIDVPERGVSCEHHGGNPVVAADGSIFVGIGEYNGRKLAQVDHWNGGRIWRVYDDGSADEYVRGLRNPFDFVWDEARQRLIVPDNGPIGQEDELNVVTKGANCGWPWAFGYEPHFPGSTAPAYVWPQAPVPTGALGLSGANDQLRAGIVITGFYSHAVHYFPSVDLTPVPEPILVVDTGAQLLDIAEARDGRLVIASYDSIYELVTPKRGDCDGDGLVSAADAAALALELRDAPEPRINAQNGSFVGSWGCDANGDDVIDSADAQTLAAMLGRRRLVGRGRD